MLDHVVRRIYNLAGQQDIPGFDHVFYSAYYADLSHLKSERELRKHYILYGGLEGRFKSENDAINTFELRFGKLPDDFDAEAYKSLQPDLAAAFAHPVDFALHYLEFGKKEGRKYKDVLLSEYRFTYDLVTAEGVVPSRRPPNDSDLAIETPFRFDPRPKAAGPIAAVVHCFYPEVLPLILTKLVNVPGSVDLYLSTDTEAKKTEAAKYSAEWRKGSVDIRIFPNRGRDIAPKIVGFRDVYAKYDLFLHLHTKKSLHAGDLLAGWRDYLLDSLIGSPEIARSNLALFNDQKLGIVFPQHFFAVRGMLNWGYDYDLARGLLSRVGVNLNKNLVLEFPSGSMFWGRSAAMRPLLDLILSFSDFPVEAGQVDGTLAHAIERSYLMFAESKGYEWLKVVRRDHYPLPRTVLPVYADDDVAKHRLRVFQPCLSRADSICCTERLGIPETKVLLSYPSRARLPRINLIVPTVNPPEIYGGISTAIKLFEEIANVTGDTFDRRIIVTDSAITRDGYESLKAYSPVAYSQSLDFEPMQIVDATDRAYGRLNVRAGDIFIATAWWTARHALHLGDEQKLYFGKKPPLVYFIQDDEPYFYGWSSKWALAELTYRHGDDTVAIINSEELYSEMTKKYRFRSVFCYRYRINDKISDSLSARPRERLMLVYARPHALRNAFELICEGLHEWQQRDPVRAQRWNIVCLGEQFDKDSTFPVQNISVVGKVSLEVYADYLSRASVGISLMLSPHPSYPPLEMAEAGLTTITNCYGRKNLRSWFSGIISLNHIEPLALADAIESAVDRTEPHIGKIIRRASMQSSFWKRGKQFDPVAFAELMRKELNSSNRWWRSFTAFLPRLPVAHFYLQRLKKVIENLSALRRRISPVEEGSTQRVVD